MSIFGCIVSGRLVQTDFQQVGERQFVITIPEADNINHIVIFLTGAQPLPVGLAGLGNGKGDPSTALGNQPLCVLDPPGKLPEN